jgi:chemotaxis protein methyltransferase WspC
MTEDQTEIECLLAGRIGLDPVAVGPHLIGRAARRRMTDLGLDDLGAYASRLGQSEAELQALIEEVVIPESWFFRDERPFRWLGDYVGERWLNDPARPPVRILSLACAGGEEPYSIAMTLWDLGLPACRFRIDAVDISSQRLAVARRGVYSANSFRGSRFGDRARSREGESFSEPARRQGEAPAEPAMKAARREPRPPGPAPTEPRPRGITDSHLGVWARHFREHPQGHELDPAIRSTVRFLQANVLDPKLLEDSSPYDVVFCRNLLIYLDVPARAVVAAALDRLLAADGVLFIGHADRLAPAGVLSGLTLVDEPGCFAYRRAAPEARLDRLQLKPPQPMSSPVAPGSSARTREPAAAGGAAGVGIGEASGGQGVAPVAPPPTLVRDGADVPEPSSLLEQAAELANRGRHAEAIVACERHLRLKGPGASAYYLMGMICQAAGERRRAEDCFHKTVYLDPKHDEALLALALSAERRGDRHAAAGFRRRAHRTASTTTTAMDRPRGGESR